LNRTRLGSICLVCAFNSVVLIFGRIYYLPMTTMALAPQLPKVSYLRFARDFMSGPRSSQAPEGRDGSELSSTFDTAMRRLDEPLLQIQRPQNTLTMLAFSSTQPTGPMAPPTAQTDERRTSSSSNVKSRLCNVDIAARKRQPSGFGSVRSHVC
jgi:hypothetical protein